MKLLAIVTLAIAAVVAHAQDMPADYAGVLTTLGKNGDYKANVLRVIIPRGDLHVRVAGTDVPTPFGFAGWIAMTKGDHGMDVMMGDLVLLQDEVNPVMSALLDNGLEVTALHNHFFWDEPKIYYMHVHGMGTPAELAQKIKPAVDLIGHADPSASQHSGPSDIQGGTLDTKALDAIVGTVGDLNGQVYKYTIGRNDLMVKDMGATINARMGLNTWAAFYGTNEKAVVAGDVAMLEGEVTRVLKALRANGLNVVAIHHHMTDTKPMIIFLHYWGKGEPANLAKGFKAALDELGKGALTSCLLSTLCAVLVASPVPIAQGALKHVQDIPLPGSANRFDYQSLDPVSGRLYMTHLAGDSVVVFDTKTRKVVKDIHGLARAHGALWVPKMNRLYVSATGSHEIAVVDPKTLETVARVPGGSYPDGIAFDPIHSRLFVSDEHGGASVAIDAKHNRFLKSIPLGDDVGNSQWDAPAKRILVTVGSSDDLVAIDPGSLEVTKRVHLSEGKGVHGLLIHPSLRIGYVACETTNQLLVVDLETFGVLGAVSVGESPDVLAYDPNLHRLYVACEGGTLSILKVDAKGMASKLEDLAIPHAHTVCVDPKRRVVYLPLENIDGRPVLRIFEEK